MERPFFSIIIPSKDRPHELARALRSVASQTWRSFETIVINDGSTYDYAGVRSQYSGLIRYVESSKSRGVSHARNVAMKLAQGSWVVFLDDDDEFTSKYLAVLHDAIVAEPKVDFLWSDVDIHTRGPDGRSVVQRRNWKHRYRNRGELYRDALAIGAGFGLAVKRACLEAVGGFDEEMRLAEDVDLVASLLAHGAVPMPVEFVGVIKHEAHSDRLSCDQGEYSKTRVFEKILDRYRGFFSAHEVNEMALLVWAAFIHSRSGNVRFELDCLRRVCTLGYRRSALKYVLWRVLGDRIQFD